MLVCVCYQVCVCYRMSAIMCVCDSGWMEKRERICVCVSVCVRESEHVCVRVCVCVSGRRWYCLSCVEVERSKSMCECVCGDKEKEDRV